MSFFADWTEDELKGFRKELAAALVSGADEVRFADRSVRYKSVADMRAALGLVDKAITALEGGSSSPKRVRLATRTGWR